MLCKKICKQCYKESFAEQNLFYSKGQSSEFEDMWEIFGQVKCKLLNNYSVGGFPPEFCPYALEQMYFHETVRAL